MLQASNCCINIYDAGKDWILTCRLVSTDPWCGAHGRWGLGSQSSCGSNLRLGWRQEACSAFWKPLSPSPKRSSIIPVWSSNCPFCISNLQCQPQSRKLTCPSSLGAAQVTPGVSRIGRAPGGSDPPSSLHFLQSHSPGDSRRCEQWMKPASCPTTRPECTRGTGDRAL